MFVSMCRFGHSLVSVMLRLLSIMVLSAITLFLMVVWCPMVVFRPMIVSVMFV